MNKTIFALMFSAAFSGLLACATAVDDPSGEESAQQSEEAMAAPKVNLGSGSSSRFYAYVCQEVSGSQCASGHCGCSSSGCGNAGAGSCTSHATCRFSDVSACSKVAPPPTSTNASKAAPSGGGSTRKQVYTCHQVGSAGDCGSACGDPVGALDQCVKNGHSTHLECAAVPGSSCS